MINGLYLAWKYILHHKLKTIILVASITLICYLPIGLSILVDRSEEQLMQRALMTPLVIGSKGSSLDLVINTLYFESSEFDELTMSAADKIDETGFALSIPMFIKFQARRFPIVGTTLDYFDFRGLETSSGDNIAVLGDCVLGAAVAEELGLGPGDTVVSSPENVLDIAGVYPLQMNIVGVLKQMHTPDDNAIFTDLKTAWVIQGLGHGHEDLAKTEDRSVLMGIEGKNYIANAKLFDNRAFPITAVIAVPHSSKDEALLMGRYISKNESSQIIKPLKVVNNLLAGIFKIKNFLDSVFFLVAISTILLLVLVIMLSLRLREKEISTMYKIGSSRFKIAELISFELLIVLIISLCLAGILSAVTTKYVNEFIRLFIV